MGCLWLKLKKKDQYVGVSSNINFPSSDRYEKFTFSGDWNEKSSAKAIWVSVGQLDFIPSDIFQEFSSLNGLAIYGTFTTIKNGLFSSYHDRVVYLDFGYSTGRTNLKWLRVRNQVQHLDPNLFETNLKLEYIDFAKNKISSVDRNLFKNLNHLKIVDFSGNPGEDVKLGCETCLITQSQLDEAFGVLETTTLPTTGCEELRENVTAIMIELDKFQTKFDKIMKHLGNIKKNVIIADA